MRVLHAHGVPDASSFLNKNREPRDKAIFLAFCFLIVNQQIYGRAYHIDIENKTKRAIDFGCLRLMASLNWSQISNNHNYCYSARALDPHLRC